MCFCSAQKISCVCLHLKRVLRESSQPAGLIFQKDSFDVRSCVRSSLRATTHTTRKKNLTYTFENLFSASVSTASSAAVHLLSVFSPLVDALRGCGASECWESFGYQLYNRLDVRVITYSFYCTCYERDTHRLQHLHTSASQRVFPLKVGQKPSSLLISEAVYVKHCYTAKILFVE